MGKDWELTLAQLAVIFSVCVTDNHRPLSITPLSKVFTEDEECNTQHMTTGHLHFLILLYLQRFLGFTLFGRSKPHSYEKLEIFLMGNYLFHEFDYSFYLPLVEKKKGMRYKGY